LANGQPMNDKRNGRAFFNKIEQQNYTIRNLKDSIKITERAINREQGKVFNVKEVSKTLPAILKKMIKSGKITQWRKHPTFFFVNGVKKARIHLKDGKVYYRYGSYITTKKDAKLFSEIYLKIKKGIDMPVRKTKKLKIGQKRSGTCVVLKKGYKYATGGRIVKVKPTTKPIPKTKKKTKILRLTVKCCAITGRFLESCKRKPTMRGKKKNCPPAGRRLNRCKNLKNKKQLRA